jgi:probable phosphoglycerate mutase
VRRVIIVLRHGATIGDNGQKYIGHADIPLGPEGEKQALRLRRALEQWPIASAYSSDLARCRQTAEIVLADRGTKIVTRRDLRETAMGEWEGHFRREIATIFPEDYAARGRDIENHRVKGGENFKDCHARVVSAFRDIVAESTDNILIAGHGSINRLLLCHMLGMPISNLFRLGQDHGCMNLIQWDGTEYRVTLLNFTPP